MKTTRQIHQTLLAIVSAVLLSANPTSAQSTTSISFQGALNGPNGQPLPNGSYNMTFRFWDAQAPGGNAISTNILLPSVQVVNGLASCGIPADPSWFNGQTRYLGMAVNSGAELLPRVMVTAVLC